jgi:8-amino-7-oxononanoate synthase
VGGLGERLADGLAALDRDGLLRRRRVLDSPQGARVVVDGRELVNFSSNDYLGLANHPAVRAAAHAAIDAYGAGAGASPLVSGHMRPHHDAELRFARFAGLPRALLFSSGYAANLGVLAALADRHAEIFADRRNHACLNDGAILARARFTRYPHLDIAALAARLAASRAGVRVVATDTVFSMDGDLAPVAELLALCERHDAWLLLDDAHGLGVIGETGRGALEHFGVRSPRIVYMGTLGKALGSYGAFVGGAPEPIEWLVQRARTYVFSTALPPAVAASAIASLDLLDADGSMVSRLHERVAQFCAAASRAALPLAASRTAIQPLLLGDARRALDASARLLERGYFVPAIRPPTVPEGTSRLRVSLSAAHAADDVAGLVKALADVLAA